MFKYTKLIGLLFTLCATPQVCAFELKSLVGNWSGRFTSKEEGEVAREYRFKMSGQYLPEGGVVLVNRFQNSSNESFTERHKFSKGGKYAVSGGDNHTTFSGTWKIDGTRILIEGKYSGLFSPGKFTGTLVFTAEDRFSYVMKQRVAVNTYRVSRL